MERLNKLKTFVLDLNIIKRFLKDPNEEAVAARHKAAIEKFSRRKVAPINYDEENMDDYEKEVQPPPHPDQLEKPWKTYSVRKARLYWLLGLVGMPFMHHWYLEDRILFPLYAITFGFGYIGWIVDGFLLSWYVARADSASLWRHQNSEEQGQSLFEKLTRCYYCFQVPYLYPMCRKRSTKSFYMDLHNREESFHLGKWVHKHIPGLEPRVMASAGFYLDATEEAPDQTICPVCDLVIWGWDEGDDPFKRHLLHSTQCTLIGKPETNPANIVRTAATYEQIAQKNRSVVFTG